MSRLVLLGTKGGPAIRPGGPMPTASLLEIAGRSAVIDCGLGVTRGLTDAGVNMKTLDLIFITHLHSDHMLELGPLLHTAWTAGLAKPVAVHGPRGLNRYWRKFLQSMDFDIEIRIADEGRPDLRDLVSVHEFAEGRVFAEGGLNVSALRVDHPPVTECTRFASSIGEEVWYFRRTQPSFRRWQPLRKAPIFSSTKRCWKTGSSAWSSARETARA